MRSVAAAILLVSAIAGSTPRAAAQEQPISPPDRMPVGPVQGGSFEWFGRVGEGPAAFSYRRSRLTNAGPAEDFAVGLFPQALSAGTVAIVADVGLAQAVVVGPVAFFGRGGVSTVLGLSSAGAAFVPGLQVGAGMLLRLDKRGALRVDVTRHAFLVDGAQYGVWSFGLGFAVLPRATATGPR